MSYSSVLPIEQRREGPMLTRTISVNFVDHVLELSLCGVLAQWAHDSAQLFGGDGAIAILVEERERLLEFCWN